MFQRLLNWIVGVTVERKREPGQSCESCCHFIDYRDPDDDPDEVNGYCGQLVDSLGLEEAVKINEYGGHWTHSGSWCSLWEGGPSLWQMEQPQSGDAVDPQAASTGTLSTRDATSSSSSSSAILKE